MTKITITCMTCGESDTVASAQAATSWWHMHGCSKFMKNRKAIQEEIANPLFHVMENPTEPSSLPEPKKQLTWVWAYLAALPLVLIASWMLSQNGHNAWVAIIGNTMAFILGQATQQRQNRKAKEPSQ